MKLLTIVLFIVLSSSSFTQENYLEYHKQAREIENKIVDSSYSEAVKMYHSLFREYDFVFAEDCFRAAQTAMIDKDSISVLTFLKRSTLQGIKMESVVKDSVLIGLTESKYWTNMSLVMIHYETFITKVSIGNYGIKSMNYTI